MSADPTRKTVALVDPLWIGHHPMYFSQFTAAFLRLGARVIGLCPDPADALQAARKAALTATPDFDRRVSMHLLPAGRQSWFGGRFEGDPLLTFHRWKRAADALHQAELAAGRQADLVFFPYLDSYLRFLPFPAVPGLALGRPWSGLYLRNHHHGEPPSPLASLRRLAKGDALLRSALCRGIGVLDERFTGPLERYTGQEVLAFPDVTDPTLPARPAPLAAEIRRKAKGRKIIGLIGLERRKGMLNLLRVADRARELRLPWYFVCAGRYEHDEYDAAERALIDRIASRVADGGIDNLHFDPAAGRIPDEADFNSVFASFDLAWIAYEGFEGSSGTLGKAAAFEIPCVATKGECIGGRVERYRSGLTIPEGDSDRAFEAIRRLLDGLDWDGRPLAGDFARFRADHDQSKLDAVLRHLLSKA
jgi:glycosyltransferase involved in cell wall biosynthesis